MSVVLRYAKDAFPSRIGEGRSVMISRTQNPFVPGGGGSTGQPPTEQVISIMARVSDYPLVELSNIILQSQGGVSIKREILYSFSIDDEEEYLDARLTFSGDFFYAVLKGGFGDPNYRLLKIDLQGNIVDSLNDSEPQADQVSFDTGPHIPIDIHGNLYISIFRGGNDVLIKKYDPDLNLLQVYNIGSESSNHLTFLPDDHDFSFVHDNSQGYIDSSGNIGFKKPFSEYMDDLETTNSDSFISNIIIGESIFLSSSNYIIKVNKQGEVQHFINGVSMGYWFERSMKLDLLTSSNRLHAADDLGLIDSLFGGSSSGRIVKIGSRIFATNAGASTFREEEGRMNFISTDIDLLNPVVKIIDGPPLPPLDTFSLDSVEDSIQITWSEVPGVTSYEIWMDGSKVISIYPDPILNQHHFTIEDVSPGFHEVYLTSVADGLVSIRTASKFVSNGLHAPVGVEVITDIKNATASWQNVTVADSYNLYLNGIKHNQSPIAGLEYTIQDLEPGDYQFYVTAIEGVDESEASDIVEFTIDEIIIQPPTNFDVELVEVPEAPTNFDVELVDAPAAPINFDVELE